MPNPSPVITIRPLAGPEDAQHLQWVHGQIWGEHPEDLLPIHVLVTLAANGGMVLGAFDPAGPVHSGGMVGFVLGWLGTTAEGKLKHVSHIAGVLEGWRRHEIGLRLKLAQRDFVLAQGLTDHVTWTCDPLQRVNGRFNMHRLGAICSTYKVNVYGEMVDDLNRGLPSDRFQMEWFLESQRVVQALAQGQVSPSCDPASLFFWPGPLDGPGSLPQDGAPLAVPAPLAVNLVPPAERAQILAWRFYLRHAMQTAFAAGYVLTDCLDLGNGRGWHYVLVREPLGLDPSPARAASSVSRGVRSNSS